MQEQPKIRVVVRKRPLTKKEQHRGEADIVEVRDGNSVIVRQKKEKVDLTKFIDQHHFVFDNAYDERSDNSTIYLDCVRPIVESAFLGARVTCFAYGQTGSGKTYTMNGDGRVAGLYVLGAQDIFHLRDQGKFRHLSISLSFYEIYCGRLHDLLNNRQELQLRVDAKERVNVIGLTQKRISSVQEFMQIIEVGSAVRITSQNSTNADSSRSHAILQIALLDVKKIYGKISFIDLAGCERGADTIDMNKQTRIDGAEINKSLLALKQCIRSLDNGKAHTPFRDSKLTMVLKDSFIGFCRTLMIGNISPNESACENTLNTLRYADRVKQLKKGSQETISKEDQLAKELMLPRMQKNRQTVQITSEDSENLPPGLFTQKKETVMNVMKMEEQRPGTNRYEQRQHSRSEMQQQFDGFQSKKQALVTNFRSNHPQRTHNSKSLNQSVSNNAYQKTSCRYSEQLAQPLANANPVIQLPQPPQPPPANKPLGSEQYNNWQQMLEQFRTWQPMEKVEVHRMAEMLQEMQNLMVREEHEVAEHHKGELQFEHQNFNQSLRLYNLIAQHNQGPDQLLGYSSNLQGLIDRKIALLFGLKNKLSTFKYHVKEQQDCLSRLQQVSDQFTRQQDEVSLLDEVHEDQQLFMKNSPQPYYYNSLQSQQQYPSFSAQPSLRYSEPMQQPTQQYMEQQRPVHTHNTRYSMNVNMNRGTSAYEKPSVQQPYETLFSGGKGYCRGYF